MGILEIVAIIGLIGSLAAGAASVGTSIYNANKSEQLVGKQFEQQKELNAQSQEYYKQNSATQYLRQRELTQDAPLLNKSGMQKAGLSTVNMQGGNSVASPAEGTAPSSGSAPSYSSVTQALSGLTSSLGSLGVSLSEIPSIMYDQKIKKAQATQLEIDNLTRAQENYAKLNGMLTSNQISYETYKRAVASNRYIEELSELELRQKRAEVMAQEVQPALERLKLSYQEKLNNNMDIKNQLDEESLKQSQFVTQTQNERFWNEMLNYKIDRQAKAQSIEQSIVSTAHERVKMYQTEIQNELQAANVPYADEIAKLNTEYLTGQVDVLEQSLREVAERANQMEFITRTQKDKYIREASLEILRSFVSTTTSLQPIFAPGFSVVNSFLK